MPCPARVATAIPDQVSDSWAAELEPDALALRRLHELLLSAALREAH
jgi:hypothetical protein